ncbi:ribosomal-protein-alanine N-acetyltransferase [Arthrobacter pascens]|uniref:GNAT family N-acetyltransferase n=1 Tax=Arthrobacter pascens TaxID=1677 RepID=UPI002793563F|nr:GNAT family N-acetyltransferase [Arthrobacter pascens]MDQ0680179.1 ribosomal-protein-alanine N-acetyltransferase [Arthrobacter pascens]
MSAANIAPISTDRLTLRLLTGSDAAALHRFRGDKEATRFLSHPALTVEENGRRLEERLAQAEASTSEWFNYGWAIILQESGEIIGDGRTWNSSASPISGVMAPGNLPVHQASLGYVLHPDHHGCGFGREAAGALVDWLFGERGISTVFAGVYEPNLASMNLLKSLGFTQDRYVPSELDNSAGVFPR